MSMAQMSSPTSGNPEVSSLLHNLTVNTEANAVKVSLSIPENEVEMLIKMGAQHHAPRI